jgi:hypothetical protein
MTPDAVGCAAAASGQAQGAIMTYRRGASAVLWYQGIPLAMGVALSWANELWGLPARLFGGEHAPDWRESALETLLVLLVGVPMMLLTRRLVSRLYHVEGLLRICSWCRRVGHGDEWMSLEVFFRRGFETRTTHGMCPDCHAKAVAEIEGAAGPRGR